MNPISETKKETKKELFEVLNKLKNEINSFRNDLNKGNNDKESWFRKKKYFSDNIKKNIQLIKENKENRDSLTKKVKELKEKRNNLSQETRKKISEINKLKSEIKNLTKKSKIKDPYKIKGQIDQLEVKLETEAMPFEKEKELSKKIKQLRKYMDDASAIINILNKAKKLNLDINTTKKNAQDTHNEIQKLAKESQELHENIIKNSKEIDDLKIKELEAFKNFVNFKKNFNSTNTTLKEKLNEINEVREKINKFKLEEDEKRKLRESMIIKNKEKEIEEKIKGGKKLTTDDFLAFQEVIKDKNVN